jgi:hypothetical protein
MTDSLRLELLLEQIKSYCDADLLAKLKRTIADDVVERANEKKRKARDAAHNKKEAKRRAKEEARLAPIQAKLDALPYDIEATANGYQIVFNTRGWEDDYDEEEDDKLDAFVNWIAENIAGISDGDFNCIEIETDEAPESLVASLEKCKNEQWLALARR